MRSVLRCAIVGTLLPVPLVAQLGVTGISALRGEVRDLNGQPIGDVQILALSVGVTAQSDSNGRFQVEGLQFGEERLLFRRRGFNPVETTLIIDAKHEDVVVRMWPHTQEPKPVVVPGRRSALLGTVADIDDRPIADVEVTVLGGASATRTDSSGRFILPNVPPGTFMIMARKRGYLVVRQSVTLPAGEALTLSLLLSEVPRGLNDRTIDRLAGIGGIDEIIWDAHVARRIRCTEGNTLFVTREEIATQGNQRLDLALHQFPSVRTGGFTPDELDRYAVFVDGIGTGSHLSAFQATDVEAVEVYRGSRSPSPTSPGPMRTNPTSPFTPSQACNRTVWVWLR